MVHLCVFSHCLCFVDNSSSKAVVGGPPLVTNEVVQDLKQNIYKLEEEVLLLLQPATSRDPLQKWPPKNRSHHAKQ